MHDVLQLAQTIAELKVGDLKASSNSFHPCQMQCVARSVGLSDFRLQV